MTKLLKTKLILFTGIMAMCVLTGCDNEAADGNVQQIDISTRSEQANSSESITEQEGDTESVTEQESETVQTESATEQESKTVQTENYQNESTDETTELHGEVISVGDNSVVVNKIFIESSAFGNGDVMIIGNGEDNQELITVHFDENASYIYQTIRNGGQDVETREGSFSDITEGLKLHMTGRYEGGDFCADNVEIHYVVLSDPR